MDLVFIGFFAVLACAIGLYAVSVPQVGRAWWWLAAAIVVLVIGSKLIGDSLTGTIFLDMAELAAVALVWSHGTPEAAAAGRKYLYSIIPAIACTMIALALIGTGEEPLGPAREKLVVCLVIVGFALKLGLIPFYFWLPAVASAAAPMTTALIVSVVDIATFGELAALREVSPWIIGGPAGIAGASLGALNHALSKVILFGAVGFAERQIGRTVTLDTSGLAARLPLAGAAFIIGALVFIGVPPGFGFVAYWRIYIAATQFGGPALIIPLLVVAALDLLCYARAIHRTWLGPAKIPVTGAPAYLAPGVLAFLAVMAVLLGCYPSILTAAAASGLLASAQ